MTEDSNRIWWSFHGLEQAAVVLPLTHFHYFLFFTVSPCRGSALLEFTEGCIGSNMLLLFLRQINDTNLRIAVFRYLASNKYAWFSFSKSGVWGFNVQILQGSVSAPPCSRNMSLFSWTTLMWIRSTGENQPKRQQTINSLKSIFPWLMRVSRIFEETDSRPVRISQQTPTALLGKQKLLLGLLLPTDYDSSCSLLL